jgi:hypothetical protein
MALVDGVALCGDNPCWLQINCSTYFYKYGYHTNIFCDLVATGALENM